MPIYERGNSFQVQVSKNGKRHRENFLDRVTAETWEREAKAYLATGKTIDQLKTHSALSKTMQEQEDRNSPRTLSFKPPENLHELAELVIKREWNGTEGGTTSVPMARSMVQLIGPKVDYREMTHDFLKWVVSELVSQGNKPATVKRKLSCVSKMLTYAQNEGWMDRVIRIPTVKIPEHRTRTLTAAEEKELLSYLRHEKGQDDIADIVVIALDTGLRRSEVVFLDVRNLSPDGVKVFGSGSKNGKSRTVPLTTRAREILERRADYYGRGRLFPKVSRTMPTRWIKRAREHFGWGDDVEFVFHAMRHTFCTRLAQAGEEAPKIQALAGHANMSMTQIYVNMAAKNMGDSISKLEEHNRQASEEDPHFT